ncbi:MAG: efflux RND transporter periplasmic adaptor subunit [Patescibacteria group bacterium]|nr:efflux RND transporter periplasmic adaptor subunit [Patescibacteria group bacterium]
MVKKFLGLWDGKKYYFIAGFVLVLFGLLMFFLLRPPPAQEAYTVKRENFSNTVLADATYTTASQTSVWSPTNGTLTKLFVANGRQVKKGDPLFHVESSATDEEKRTAYANYMADKSTLDAATAELYTLQSDMYAAWKTYTDLAKNSTYQNSDGTPRNDNRVLTEFTTAQDDWLAAEANFKNQQTVIAKDQAAVAKTWLQNEQTQSVTVNSPAAGTVTNLLSQVNDEVAVKPADPVLLVANFHDPYLLVSLNEVNIPKVKVGQKATVVFDALPDKTYHGEVETLDNVGTKVLGTVTFDARIKIVDGDNEIKPNMTASITITTSNRQNVLTVPNSALTEKNGQYYVQKAGSSGNNLTPVKVGLKGLVKSEISSGLTEGEQILVPR